MPTRSTATPRDITSAEIGVPTKAPAALFAAPRALPTRQAVPDALADVSLVDAKQIAAALCVCLSTLYEMLRMPGAPAPAIRGHRFTRWRLSEVRAWIESYVAQHAEAGSVTEAHPTVQMARKAQAAGLAKRRARMPVPTKE